MAAQIGTEDYGTLEVRDKDGWRKAFPLERALTYIGQALENDIVLEEWRGRGVAPRHLQLIAAPGQRVALQAVNLSDTEISRGNSGAEPLSPFSAAEIADGETLSVGEFLLVFHMSPATRPEIRHSEDESQVIGLSLSLRETVLRPDRPLEGTIVVSNQGDQPGVQFMLEVEGLDRECYEVGPGPILFPGKERDVPLRLHHPRKPSPAAGRHRIRVRATAPEAYGGECTTVSQDIEILPYYRHTIVLRPEKRGTGRTSRS